MYNRDYIKSLLPKDKKILEFGPLNSPIVDKKYFPNVKYTDIKTTEEIKRLYSGNEYLKSTGIKVDINTIVEIDYVVKTSYKKDIKEKFDIIVLSHVIEHMPDIINFFQEVKSILNENGLLIINYPDKRYCFDHYRGDTSFKDAYMTYKKGIKENDRQIFDFYINVMHENNPNFFGIVKILLLKKIKKVIKKF